MAAQLRTAAVHFPAKTRPKSTVPPPTPAVMSRKNYFLWIRIFFLAIYFNYDIIELNLLYYNSAI